MACGPVEVAIQYFRARLPRMEYAAASPTQAGLIDITAERQRHLRFLEREDVPARLDAQPACVGAPQPRRQIQR